MRGKKISKKVWDVGEVGDMECDGVVWELANPPRLQAGILFFTSAAAGSILTPLQTQTYTQMCRM